MQPIMYQDINSFSESFIDRRFYRDYSFCAHIHANPEVVYVSNGVMDVEIDGRTMQIEPGQFCLILPWQIHSYKTKAASQSVIVVFPPRYLRSFLNGVSQYHGQTQVFAAEEEVRRLFLRYLWGDTTPDEQIFAAILHGLAHGFIKNCRLVPNASRNNIPALVQIMNYISENYQESLSLNNCAKALGYSYSYLSHLFRKSSGFSFHRFCNQMRVEHSCQMLAETEKPITDIAFECGFDNTRTFNRVFLQLMRMSPSEYRTRYSVVNTSAQEEPVYLPFTPLPMITYDDEKEVARAARNA